MDFTPWAQSRRRLLDDFTFSSVASSTGSAHGTLSDDDSFNPERDEAFGSTGLIDQQQLTSTTPGLPQIRDTAKKAGRWSPRRQPEVQVNSSAIGRAFADFTSSHEDASIENPRANLTKQKNTTPVISLPADRRVGSLQVLSTPKIGGRKASDTADFTNDSTFDLAQNIDASASRKPYDRRVSDQSHEKSTIAAPADYSASELSIAKSASLAASPKKMAQSLETSDREITDSFFDFDLHKPITPKLTAGRVHVDNSAGRNVSNPRRRSYVAREDDDSIVKEMMDPNRKRSEDPVDENDSVYQELKAYHQKISSKAATDNSITGKLDVQLHKENVRPSHDVGRSDDGRKRIDYISNASRTFNGERRTLAELHARVADDSDSSLVGEDRQNTNNSIPTKASRFVKPAAYTPHHRATAELASGGAFSGQRQQSAARLDTDVRVILDTPTKPQGAGNSTSSSFPNPTQHSFLLPNNGQTELVSGLDLRAVSNSGAKVQPRFTPGADSGANNSITIDAAKDGVDQEEEDIYFLIESLRAQVAELQRANEEAYAHISDLEKEGRNNQVTVSAAQKEKRDFQTTLSAVEKKNSESRGSMSTLRAEGLHLQKTVSLLRSEVEKHLVTISRLANENDDLQSTVSGLETENQENQTTMSSMQNEWQKHHQFNEDLNNENLKCHATISALEKENRRHQKVISLLEKEKSTSSTKLTQSQRTIKVEQDKNTKILSDNAALKARIEELEAERDSALSHGRDDSELEQQLNDLEAQNKELEAALNRADQRYTQMKAEMRAKRQKIIEAAGQNLNDVQNDHDKIIKKMRSDYENRLRGMQINEQKHKDAQEKLEKGIKKMKTDHEHRLRDMQAELETGLAELENRRTVTFDLPSHTAREESDDSEVSQERYEQALPAPQVTKSYTMRRRAQSDTNMTSEFIIPEIEHRRTLSMASITSAKSAKSAIRGVSNDVKKCKHSLRNCTVCCTRSLPRAQDDAKITHRVHMERPIPVSEMPASDCGRDDATGDMTIDDPTLRGQDPGRSLAIVFKFLKDEAEHLKIEHQITVEKFHISSRSGRKSKSLKEEMDKAAKAVDAKFKQLYHLNDVLEGQKAAGQLMTEREFDLTMQDVGIDLTELSLQESLPWEGFEED